MRKPLVVVATLVVSVPALFSAEKPAPAAPPKPTVVAKPESKPGILTRVFGRKDRPAAQPATEEKKTAAKPETTKPEAKKPAEKPEAAKPEAAKPEKTKTGETSKPKRAEKPKADKPKTEEKPAKPEPKSEEPAKAEEPGKTGEPAKSEEPAKATESKPEAPAEEPKAEKPEVKETKADSKSKKGKKGAKPAPAKLDTTGMDDSTKFQTVKALVQEDEVIKALKAKADSAIAEDDAHEASVAYNRALFRKIREMEPSLEGYANKLEGAMMKRLQAEKK